MPIKIPDRINVGYQNRSETYTGKLAYVIYFDHKGMLRKEKSWNGWRDKKIDNDIYNNEPTDGFVLNKKVGGYSSGWNHRQSYIRVYDPRGFEFEITPENLLYILENTNSIKGKGLEGKFVYGWDGKDLLLIPCNSPDYEIMKDFNNKVKKSKRYKMKDMIIGATYLNKDNISVIYMGRYKYYSYYTKQKKMYYFAYESTNGIITVSNLGNYILDKVDDKCVENYADLFSKLERLESYNPYDTLKDEFYNHTLESFTKYVLSKSKKNYRGRTNIEYAKNNSEEKSDGYFPHGFLKNYYPDLNAFKWRERAEIKDGFGWHLKYESKEYKQTIEEFFNEEKPQWKKEYLLDGKLRRELYK